MPRMRMATARHGIFTLGQIDLIGGSDDHQRSHVDVQQANSVDQAVSTLHQALSMSQ